MTSAKKCNLIILLNIDKKVTLSYLAPIGLFFPVYTDSKIKSRKKNSYKIFDFKSRDSTFKKAIEKRGDVSSMHVICMTKQRKQILPRQTERYKTKIPISLLNFLLNSYFSFSKSSKQNQ